MARLMSVSLTEPQVRARAKTVTRRVGWHMLRTGDHLTLCRKVMGRRRGEPLERIVTVEVTSLRREPLGAITAADVTAEGFPQMTPAEFVSFFCSTHRGCGPDTEVGGLVRVSHDGALPSSPDGSVPSGGSPILFLRAARAVVAVDTGTNQGARDPERSG